MNKQELIKAISEESGLNQKLSTAALNAITTCLQQALSKGDAITLTGFARISVKKRAARKGRNPATGQPLDIKAHNIVSFKAGSQLKEAINR